MKKVFEYKGLKVEPQPNPVEVLLFKVYLSKDEKDPKYYIFGVLDTYKIEGFKTYILKEVKKDGKYGFSLEELFRGDSQTLILEYILKRGD